MFDGALFDQAGRLQAQVDIVGAAARLSGVRRVVVIEANMKTGKIAGMLVMHPCNQRFGGNPLLFGTQHNRRAVRIVGANIPALVPAHFLETHPDVGLNVLDQMAKMYRAIGVGERGGNEDLASHGSLISGKAAF